MRYQRLQREGARQELTVDDAWQRAKRPLTDPEFKAGGVKLIRSAKDAVPETLKQLSRPAAKAACGWRG